MITINGKTFHGSNITVINDRVFIDGKEVNAGDSSGKILEVVISGETASINSEAPVTVNGNVHGNVKTYGALQCSGSITGKVDAGVSVNCGDINGNVNAGGSVNCGYVSGGIDAGGSVNRKGNRVGVVGNNATINGGIKF